MMLLALLAAALPAAVLAGHDGLSTEALHAMFGLKLGDAPRVDEDGLPLVSQWTLPAGAVAATPFHYRVSYGTRPTNELHFSWTSNDGASKAALLIGEHSGKYTVEPVDAEAPVTYAAEDMCGAFP